MLSRGRLCVLLLVLLSFSSLALARERRPARTDPPLVNWSAPATYTPLASPSRIRTLGDISGPMPFIPVDPCRQYDSHGSTPLPNNTPRTISISGAPCGIPAGFFGAVAASVNITVFNIAGAAGNGVFRVGTVSPPPTAWINFPPTETQRANAGIVSLSGGNIIVQVNMGAGQIDFTIDVNGYYASAAANPGNTFTVINSGGMDVPAILGATSSAAFNATGVKGQAVSTTGVTNGVWGDSLSNSDGATGVFGFAEGTSGVTTGVWGRSVSSSDDSRGVYGEALATTGRIYGVYGFEAGNDPDSAGVRGVEATGAPVSAGLPRAGVRGESKFNVGVFGISQVGGESGILGYRLSSAGDVLSGGSLGDPTGVGVYYFNGLAGTGTKSFVEPHPTDATKLIKYVSLEGPEAGVYFRGRGQAHRGLATIDVPENFRMVASEEGLSIQVTPIGELANVAVTQIDLSRIAIKTSRDVEFFYTVSGVRRAYPTWDPIQENRREFVPKGPGDKLPAYLSPNETQRLIANGTYNADGTVNMETAQRVGWTKMWAERGEQAKAAAAKFAAERKRE